MSSVDTPRRDLIRVYVKEGHLEVPYQALKVCETREVVRSSLRYRRYATKNFEKFNRGWRTQVQNIGSLQGCRYNNKTSRVLRVQ